MSGWEKEYHLWIDLNAPANDALVRVSGSTISPASASPLVQGDARKLVLHFGTRGDDGWTDADLETGDDIMFLAKSQAGAELFYAETFVHDAVAHTYTATLDLNTVNLASAMTGTSLTAQVDIEVSGGSLIATFQFDVTVLKERYTGDPPSIEGGPSYYTQAQVDALIASIISVPEGMRLRVTEEGAIVVEEVEA